MPYYKDSNNALHFLESASFAHLLPSGCVQITDAQAAALQAPSLEQRQTIQCAAMDSAYKTAVESPIDYMGTSFQADKDSQSLVTDVITAAGGSLPAGFVWYDTDNNPVEMTFAQLQGLAGSILARGQPLFYHKQTKKAAIRAATTKAQVEAITW